jgi:aryl-alcohol dehydrogenase
VDIRPQRLALAQELGATHVINGSEGKTTQQIQQITGRGADYALDTTGIPGLIRQAVEGLHARGTCGVLGMSLPGTEVTFTMESILAGRTLRGIIEGDSVSDLFIPHLIDLYVQGRFPFDRLITTFPFAEINAAVAASESGDVLKPVLTYA